MIAGAHRMTLWIQYETFDSGGWVPKADGTQADMEALRDKLMALPCGLGRRFIDSDITEYGQTPNKEVSIERSETC